MKRRQVVAVAAGGAMTALVATLALRNRPHEPQVPRRRFGPPAGPLPALPPPGPDDGPALRTRPGVNHLLDAQGRPWLLVGESAWSLLARLGRGDIERFLDDRARRGYTAVLVNLIESHFSPAPPRDSDGVVPFLVPSRFDSMADYLERVDFDTPNDAYFERLDHLAEAAARRGLLVMVAPAYLGYRGGEQGWWRAVERTPLEALRSYGRYLGQRTRRHRNLMWVHGGDFNAPRREPVDAIAQGLRDYAPEHLHVYHGDRGTASHQWQPQVEWLGLGTVYTDHVVHPAVAARRLARPGEPFILIEAYYEGYNTAPKDPRLSRWQAYQAMLGGACGQLSGHDAIWQFRDDWRAHLDSATARSMSVLARVLRDRAWWLLEPDTQASFLRPMAGQGSEHLSVAVARDASWAIAYVPRLSAVASGGLIARGGHARLRWIDPTSGAITGAAPAGADPVTWKPPGPNAAGDGDWLLVLEAPG